MVHGRKSKGVTSSSEYRRENECSTLPTTVVCDGERGKVARSSRRERGCPRSQEKKDGYNLHLNCRLLLQKRETIWLMSLRASQWWVCLCAVERMKSG